MRAQAPGRVNLIGDHTDYTGGLALPMAIDRRTVVDVEPGGDVWELRSDADPEPAILAVDGGDPPTVQPPWARYMAGVLAVVGAGAGCRVDGGQVDGGQVDGGRVDGGHVDGGQVDGGQVTVATDLPVGAGLSSSAALEVAFALALGFQGTPLELALACQRAEHLASGVPSGVMDQLASAGGREGHALLIDCRSRDITPVPMPEGVEVIVADSGQNRTLVGSAYAERRAQCEAAAAIIGPLRDASFDDLAELADEVLRRRARHVVTENARVLAFADALHRRDLGAAGRLMVESHHSLRDDFAVSTPALDALVERLTAVPGVHGARLTGAGFGGCVVALAEPGTPVDGWRLRPAAGASVLR